MPFGRITFTKHPTLSHGSKRLLSIRLLVITWLTMLSLPVLSDTALKFVMQDSAPKYLIKDGRVRGLCGDVYMALKSRLNAKGINVVITKELLPIKRILMMVESGISDAYCGAGRNPKREERFIYSTLPVYSVSNVVAAHEKELFIPQSFNDLSESKALVGALLGTSSATFLKQQRGVVVDDQFHTLDNALEVLAKNQFVRFFYYHDLGLNYLVPNSGLPLKVLPTKFRSTPQWVIYSKQTRKDWRTILDEEISLMVNSGEMSAITQPYLQ
ncbi:substrate-binding periplasmic protein [Hahella ganghwensis]|uniref:substrate-binding periplasmic protein n=1 Tax=Hahella ganghwensis TaxID=286420 RepID=UPI00035E25B7|nr:transporter substrate-binding domain-containing protein [Hahella ganghwensis]